MARTHATARANAATKAAAKAASEAAEAAKAEAAKAKGPNPLDALLGVAADGAADGAGSDAGGDAGELSEWRHEVGMGDDAPRDDDSADYAPPSASQAEALDEEDAELEDTMVEDEGEGEGEDDETEGEAPERTETTTPYAAIPLANQIASAEGEGETSEQMETEESVADDQAMAKAMALDAAAKAKNAPPKKKVAFDASSKKTALVVRKPPMGNVVDLSKNADALRATGIALAYKNEMQTLNEKLEKTRLLVQAYGAELMRRGGNDALAQARQDARDRVRMLDEDGLSDDDAMPSKKRPREEANTADDLAALGISKDAVEKAAEKAQAKGDEPESKKGKPGRKKLPESFKTTTGYFEYKDDVLRKFAEDAGFKSKMAAEHGWTNGKMTPGGAAVAGAVYGINVLSKMWHELSSEGKKAWNDVATDKNKEPIEAYKRYLALSPEEQKAMIAARLAK